MHPSTTKTVPLFPFQVQLQHWTLCCCYPCNKKYYDHGEGGQAGVTLYPSLIMNVHDGEGYPSCGPVKDKKQEC